MSTLSNRSLDASYIELLKIDPTGGVNTGISASLANVETGNGTASALRLSTTQVHSTGTLTSAGLATLNSAAVTNNATIGGTLGVTGLLTATGGVSGTLTGNVAGNLSGNVNGTIGATTPNSGSFTTLGASGSSTLSSVSATSLTVSGDASFTGSGAIKMPVGATSGATGRPVSPAQGMLRYNTSLNQFEGYDGSSWAPIASGSGGGGGGGQTMYVRQTFTATASQTTFTITGGYTAYKLDVFQNGVKLVNSDVGVSRDVDVSNGTTIVLATGAAVGDVIDVIGLTSGNFAGPATARRQTYTATAAQTVFTVSGGYTVGQLDVFQNGTKLVTAVDVDVSNGSTFTLTTPAVAGDSLEVVGFTAADTVSGTLQFQAGTAAAPSITTFGDTNTGIFFPAADRIAFSTGGAEAMRINLIGDVGIGTMSPGTKLDVRGNIFTGIVGGTNNSRLSVFDGAIITKLQSQSAGDTAGVVGTESNHVLKLFTNNTARMTLDISGNVGVGTNNPSTPSGKCITIYDSGIPRLNLKNSTSGDTSTDGVEFSLNGSDAYLNNRENGTVSIATNNATKLLVDSSGNVGIGTTSPSVASGLGLVINGGASQTRLAFKNTYTGDTSTDGVQFALVGASSSFIFQNRESDGSFAFETNSVERLRIDSNGYVGIGTTAPNAKLFVRAGEAPSNAQLLIGYLNGSENYFDANNQIFRNGNAAETMRINSSGVTIATLAGTGSRSVNASAAGLLSAASDASLKEEVVGAHIAGLAEILQIHPKMYRWKDDIANRGNEAAVELGFIANDVAPIIPSAAPMGNDGLYGFYDRSVIAALVKAVQELSAKVTALEAA